MEYEGLIVVQIGNAKRKPAFQAILEFVTVAGFEVHEKEIALSAKYVIAQVNPQMPRTHGDGLIQAKRFDVMVEVNEPLPLFL